MWVGWHENSTRCQAMVVATSPCGERCWVWTLPPGSVLIFIPVMFFSCEACSEQPWECCQVPAPHHPSGDVPTSGPQSGSHLLLLSGSANPSPHHGTTSIGRAERLPTAWEGTCGFEYPLGEGGPKPKFHHF